MMPTFLEPNQVDSHPHLFDQTYVLVKPLDHNLVFRSKLVCTPNVNHIIKSLSWIALKTVSTTSIFGKDVDSLNYALGTKMAMFW
jgi:hypothetical protein